MKDPAETRRDPSALKGLGVKKVADYYEEIIRGLGQKPIIIGHSFGGLFTQLLLDRGLGAAGVVIGTATPKGIKVLPASTLRASFPALKNPFNGDGLCPLTKNQFRWRFTNTVSQEESDRIYEEHYIPGTNRAFFDAALSSLSSNTPAAVTYENPARGPLLLICGTEDRISPAAVNKKLYKLQSKNPSATELKIYPGRPHFMAGLDGWEELADTALNWSLEHMESRASQEAPATTTQEAN